MVSLVAINQQTTMRSSLLGTCFSFVLVLVFTVCMTFTSVRTYVLYGNYTGLTDHFNTVGVIFLIFWIVVVALALHLLHPLLRRHKQASRCPSAVRRRGDRSVALPALIRIASHPVETRHLLVP